MVGELTRLGQIALDADDTIAGWETESGLTVEQPEAVTLDGRQPTSTLARRILSFVSPRPGD